MRASDLARLLALTAIWGAVFLGEPVGVTTVVGGALILLASALVLELGPRRDGSGQGTIPGAED